MQPIRNALYFFLASFKALHVLLATHDIHRLHRLVCTTAERAKSDPIPRKKMVWTRRVPTKYYVWFRLFCREQLWSSSRILTHSHAGYQCTAVLTIQTLMSNIADYNFSYFTSVFPVGLCEGCSRRISHCGIWKQVSNAQTHNKI